MNLQDIEKRIFNIDSEKEFNEIALSIFHFQYIENRVYQTFIKQLHIDLDRVDHFSKIPFLPVEFFKKHRIYCGRGNPDALFHSSGTTGVNTSKHAVAKTSIYRESFERTFRLFYGDPANYLILALLPSYLERENSSLIYMVDQLIKKSGNPQSGFYLKHNDELLDLLNHSNQKILLIGVSFALLDLVESGKIQPTPADLTVMETGGMKGRRKEMIRAELHDILKAGFHLNSIHSEYGMTELLSQAYSKGEGVFRTPPWMKILIRDTNDPLALLENGKTGGINIIDLANIYSCSFISTKDLGKINFDDTFEISGRFDNSDIRGCNLMVE